MIALTVADGYQMTEKFTIESRTAEAIMVRHVAHGHRYAF
jgi:hypothetical protein